MIIRILSRFLTKKTHKEKYHAYLLSRKWKTKRKKVLARDKYRCTRCGYKKRLQVHHLTYERVFHERLSDLTTLCARCHRQEHGLDK